MPANHCFRPNDGQVPSPPTRPGAPEPDPQDTIGSAQTRLRPGPSEHFELVAQGQILEDEVVAGTTGTNKDAHEHIQEAHHRRGRISAGFSSHRKLIANRAGRSCVRDPDRLLPSYNLLRVSRSTAYAMVASGLIPSLRLSPRVLRVDRAKLEHWLTSRGAR